MAKHEKVNVHIAGGIIFIEGVVCSTFFKKKH
jgi:hypothetical protein